MDREGLPLHDLVSDAAFAERLKKKINNKDAVKEVDLHLYTPEFAKVAVEEFVRLYKSEVR